VKNKRFTVAALIAALALTLTACGDDKAVPGTGIMVYDSANKLLGYVLSGSAVSATILTPANQVVDVTMVTGKPSGMNIYFLTTSMPVNNTTIPYLNLNSDPANPSYYYNPNGGGLYFKYTGAAVNSHTIQTGEYRYFYDGSLDPILGGVGSADFYALEWITESDYNSEVYGFAPSPPLKFSITTLP
jgi:hypothetical protein